MQYLIGLLLASLLIVPQNTAKSTDEKEAEQVRKIYDSLLTDGDAYENLRYLCEEIGGRLSGSPQAAEAVEWTSKRLREMGADTVWLQEVMVPHWVRGGVERGTLINGTERINIPLCALGGSIGTNGETIRAQVVEVFNFEQLKELGREQIEGKIVLYNRPMEPRLVNTFDAYSGCVDQRSSGASEAAPFGAKAVLVRSMGLRMDDLPHTGVQRYQEGVRKIPAAAVSTNAAAMISKMLRQQPDLEVELSLSCENLPDALSHNVIAEIKGSEFPDEIILVGGHLDSWDLGQGAHDDGAGSIQSMEVINQFIKLGIRPKRTVRCVLYMNEENGAMGAKKYAEEAARKGENHIIAIESDRGGFTPRGFTVDGSPLVMQGGLEQVKQYSSLFEPYDVHYFKKGFSGVDIAYLKDQDVLLVGFVPDSQRYFDYHHAKNDRFDAVNKRELELGAAALTTLIYLMDKDGVKRSFEPGKDY